MSYHNTTNDNSNATVNENLNNEPISYFYQVNESWNQELGIIAANLFGLIDCVSTKYGYCILKTASMSEKLGIEIKTVEKYLKILEDKRWIYRNTFSIHKGSKRYIVTQRNARRYWDTYLNKPSVPEHVKDKFLDWYSLKDTPKVKEKFTPLQNGGSYDTPSNGGSLLLRNNLENKRDDNNAAAAVSNLPSFDHSKKPVHGKSISSMIGSGVALNEKDTILNELKQKPMTEDLKLILQLLEKHWSSLSSDPTINNLKRFIFGGLNKNYLLPRLKEYEEQNKEKTAAADEENRIRENKEGARFVYESMKDYQQFKVFMDDYSMRFDFVLNRAPRTMTLGFKDKDFKKKLTKAKEIADKCVHEGEK